MFTAFEKALIENKRPYILLKGDKETRLKNAVKAIDKLVLTKENLYSFSDSLPTSEMSLLDQIPTDSGLEIG
jgi:hypothetical protein